MSPIWLASMALAQGQTPVTFEAGERLRPTDEILARLGLPDAALGPDAPSWGASASARLATDLECGAINVDVDLEAAIDRVKDLPEQLAKVAPTLVESLPMLALCHMSPSACAEVKNLNLRIDQDLDFRAQVCRSIDAYIDEQADEGEQVRREAQRLAEQQCIQNAGGGAEAIRQCTENPQSGLVTDIVAGFVDEKIATGPQKLLESALQATNHELAKQPGLHALLASVAGEAQIEVNGTVIPVLEHGPLLSGDIADGLLFHGEYYACAPVRLKRLVEDEGTASDADAEPIATLAYAVDTLKQTLRGTVTEADLDNLDALSSPTHRAFCLALSRTAALEAAKTMQTRIGGLVALAEGNPELPELGKRKLQRAERVLAGVVQRLESNSQTSTFEGWSSALVAVAKAELGHERALADTLSDGQTDRNRLWREIPCNTVAECLEPR